MDIAFWPVRPNLGFLAYFVKFKSVVLLRLQCQNTSKMFSLIFVLCQQFLGVSANFGIDLLAILAQSQTSGLFCESLFCAFFELTVSRYVKNVVFTYFCPVLALPQNIGQILNQHFSHSDNIICIRTT